MSEQEVLAGEKASLGLYLSGHPIERFGTDLERSGARRIGDLLESEATVLVGGIVSGLRQVKTRRGDRMATFMLEDAGGALEVVVYPEPFRRAEHLIAGDAMLIVRGRFDKDEDSARLVASEILPISALRERVTQEVAIRLAAPPHDRATFEALAGVLGQHRGDRRVRLELEVRTDGRPLRILADLRSLRVRPSDQLITDVERLCGTGCVELR